jgi:transposase
LFTEVKRQSQEAEGATIVMAYEASSCGFVLKDEADANGVCCYVLAPTKMEKSAEQKKQKNDDRDAQDVLEKLRGFCLAGNRLPTVWVPTAQMRDDRELVRMRHEVGKKQTKVKTQIQMLLKRHGLEKPAGTGSAQTTKYRKWLEAVAEDRAWGWGMRQSLSSLLRQLGALEAELKQLDQQVDQLAREERHKPIVEALRTEKGVGTPTAMVYRTEMGYAGRFDRSRQVGRFMGLTPTSHESGQQNNRKGHISRQGPPRLRHVLCQAAWAHVRHDPHAREVYNRLAARNPKKRKIALVAMMRRLGVRLWHRMREVELALEQR